MKLKRQQTKRKREQTLSSLKKKAWKLFSLVTRKSAADHRGMASCYTCGVTLPWQELQTGHAIGGRHNAVLLDPEICRLQCARCNIFLRGNYPVFTTKLIQENGVEWMENKLIQSKQNVKWTRGELLEKIESYEKRLEELG